jgi:hypothetical protein
MGIEKEPPGYEVLGGFHFKTGTDASVPVRWWFGRRWEGYF